MVYEYCEGVKEDFEKSWGGQMPVRTGTTNPYLLPGLCSRLD